MSQNMLDNSQVDHTASTTNNIQHLLNNKPCEQDLENAFGMMEP